MPAGDRQFNGVALESLVHGAMVAAPRPGLGRAAAVRGFRVFGSRSLSELIAAARGPVILVALNAEKIGNGDERVRRIVNTNIGYPDGMGVVLALRRKGIRSARIAGADLWRPLLASRPNGSRVYLVGGTKRTIEMVVTRLRQDLPQIDICGFRDGYLGPGDVARLEASLVAARPDVVVVGMGSPRQEMLMARLGRAHPAVYVGVGGSFDVYVGRRRRAPAWMQRAGLEWVFRFVEDPSRLPRLGAYLRFAWLLARGRL